MAQKIDAREFLGNTRSPFDLVEKIEDYNKSIQCCDGDKMWEAPTNEGLKNAIPEHCRERSATTSLLFLARDFLFLAINALLAHYLIPHLCGGSKIMRVLAWCSFAFTQGTIATGVWVVGHECGHRAFSSSILINDVVGYLVHTILLVPYFAWQFSHAKHHKYTNHLLAGETHVPPVEKSVKALKQMWNAVGDGGFATYQLFVHLVAGWPLYLLCNVTGGRQDHKESRLVKRQNGGGPVDHFRSSNSQLFPPGMWLKIRLSTAGVVAMVLGLLYAGSKWGWGLLACYYVGPYLVANGWLVLYTWLHHGDSKVPHYGEESFTWFRGAMSTVDRSYPWIIDELHHHIGSTHLVHHFDSKIPHYKAVEATKHAAEYLGPFYRKDQQHMVSALWHTSKECHFVRGVKGVQFLHPIRDASA
eukprot:GHVN01051989.1.p1 GENE.GHVN01051989.1~~GHVN01051989.1.p1  ORF type:complete len:416 (-),score=32.88 GHVN01051989.1:205-1452(-)